MVVKIILLFIALIRVGDTDASRGPTAQPSTNTNTGKVGDLNSPAYASTSIQEESYRDVLPPLGGEILSQISNVIYPSPIPAPVLQGGWSNQSNVALERFLDFTLRRVPEVAQDERNLFAKFIKDFQEISKKEVVANVAHWITGFDNVTSTLHRTEQINSDTSILKIHRIDIAHDTTVHETWLFGNASFDILIPNGALVGSVYKGYRYVMIAALRLFNDDFIDEGQTRNGVNQLATDLISINIFNSDGDLTEYDDLQQPIKIMFPLQTIPGQNGLSELQYEQRVCAFWQISDEVWSQYGSYISTDGTNETHVECHFTHLTTFAGLFQFSKETHKYSSAVKILFRIGAALSIIALILGMIAFGILWRSSHINKEKVLIHVQLMLAMLLAYFLIVLSEEAEAYPTGCLILTILLYFSFLSTFAWMTVEAIHLYRMIIIVYGMERNLKVVYAIIGWGIPLCMAIITASVGREDVYDANTPKCWLSGDFIWAFIAPVLLMLLANGFILVVVIYKTIVATSNNSNIQSVKIGLRSALLLLPMLGVAWLIGLVVNVHINFVYIFDLISSVQGIYLVVVTCIVNSEVREALKREWSKTSGQVGTGQVRMINVQNAGASEDTKDTDT